MPRIRTIKPEFWSDEKLSKLDPLTRLVFVALISLADDAGRLIDNVKQLDGQIFPNTADTCGEALDTLARLSRVARYTSASGQSILQITKWGSHQRVDKPSAHVLPAPKDGTPREDVASVSQIPLAPTLDLGPRTKDQGPTTVRAKKPREVDADFETWWSMYPKRGGTNSKALAQRQWQSARRAGETVAELLDGAFRYSRLIVATGKVGTEFVMQAATFLGPGEHWREPFPIPVTPVDPREQRSAAPRAQTVDERRAAESREKSAEERQARIDREYNKARTTAITAWLPTADTDDIAGAEAKALAVCGTKTGPIVEEMRRSIIAGEYARLAGFPDQDAWVIVENARRRQAQVHA